MDNKKVIDNLVKTNDPKYNLIKACEELNELSTALLQYVNKDGKKTTAEDVIVEIADVKIRLQILEKLFGPTKVRTAYFRKLKRFENYLEKGKYLGRI